MRFLIFFIFSFNLFAYWPWKKVMPVVPVCDRTEQVKNAIVKKIQKEEGLDMDCSSADKFLDTIKVLDLKNEGIKSLKVGDFAGLSSLYNLYLDLNELSTLPSGVFSGLSSLKWLILKHNKLSVLPDGVFKGLSSLEALILNHNKLSTLPSGVLSDLSSLELLYITGNSFSPIERLRIEKEVPHAKVHFF